jgi:hypothetical protein
MFFRKRLVAVIPVGDKRELWYATPFGHKVEVVDRGKRK